MFKRKKSLKQWFLAPFDYSQGGHKPDLVLLAVIGLLLFFGLLFLSSASSSQAFYQHEHNTYFFVRKQFEGLLLGLVFFYFALRTNYQKYQKHYNIFLLVSLFLLVIVFIPGLSAGYGSAKSWILLGSTSVQTSEIVKLLLILFLAGWLTKIGNDIKDWRQGVLPFIVILGLVSLLIMLQPDLGTLGIIILTSLAMFCVAGARFKHLAVILAGGFVALLALVKVSPYRFQRVMVFLNPDIDTKGISYQIHQALIAVGSGGWFGLGLGYSRQKFNYLPEASSDSIFAIIAEEVGFLFSVGLIVLFTILMIRGFQIAKHAPDDFSKLIALGIVVWLSAQIFINIAAMISLMPLTGVPLPFFSLGGSNLSITLLSVGVLANISKYTINQPR